MLGRKARILLSYGIAIIKLVSVVALVALFLFSLYAYSKACGLIGQCT